MLGAHARDGIPVSRFEQDRQALIINSHLTDNQAVTGSVTFSLAGAVATGLCARPSLKYPRSSRVAEKSSECKFQAFTTAFAG